MIPSVALARRGRTRALASFFLLAWPVCAAAETPRPAPSTATLTLTECYRLALKTAESLQAQSERIEQAEALHRQALGGALPRLSFNASEFIQDRGGRTDSGVGSNLTRRERPEMKFVLRQPLFSGFREFAAMSGFRAQREREQLLLERASKLLFLDVAQAFYLSLQADTEISNLDTLLELTRQRIRELRERERIGKSRHSELLSSEAQAASVEAQRSALQEDSLAARDVLSFLTGSDTRSAKLVDDTSSVFDVRTEEQLWSRAQGRSDLMALRKDLEALKQRIKISRGALYPSAAALANYYTKRVGTQRDIDWDLLLSVDIPLFQGGGAGAQVTEARSRHREAELLLQRREREVRLEIQDAVRRLNSSITQTKSFQTAFEKAEESYKLQVREYRLGLVNNLEVLEALNTMQERKSDRDRALLQSKLNWLELKVAVEDVQTP